MSETFTTRAAIGALMSFLIVGATCYFAYSALQGESGLVEQVRLAREESELHRQLEALRAERQRMENLTSRLADGHLDLELLDERARSVLGYARSDEIVIR